MGTSLNIDPARKGVTLIEILVVIVIIGILTALIMGGLTQAKTAARKAVIKAEIGQLEMAVQNYKTEYSVTPPTFVNIDSPDVALRADGRAAVMRHLRKAFPRYVPKGNRTGDPLGRLAPTSDAYDKFAADVFYAYGGRVDPLNFDAASSLLFFLGGLPETAGGGAWVPAGFHSDPTFPFKSGLPRTQPLHVFKPERIVVRESHYSDPTDASSAPVDRYLRYYPEGAVGADGAPFVYFKARRIAGRWQYGAVDSAPSFVQYFYPHAVVGLELGNYCVPYRDDPSTQIGWRNYETFQIICAGLDGHFGSRLPWLPSGYRVSKTGGGFTDGDYDNLTNFSKGTLEDEIE